MHAAFSDDIRKAAGDLVRVEAFSVIGCKDLPGGMKLVEFDAKLRVAKDSYHPLSRMAPFTSKPYHLLALPSSESIEAIPRDQSWPKGEAMIVTGETAFERTANEWVFSGITVRHVWRASDLPTEQ